MITKRRNTLVEQTRKRYGTSIRERDAPKTHASEMNEYIYIITNMSMPGLIKVGKTTTHPSQRMSELHSTGVPTPFELEFSATVNSCDYSEKAAHLALANYRVTGPVNFSVFRSRKALS